MGTNAVIELPRRWDPELPWVPSPEPPWTWEVGRYWRRIHRGASAYAERVARELGQPVPRGSGAPRDGFVPLCDMELSTTCWVREPKEAAWYVERPLGLGVEAAHRLAAGTRLLDAGWDGEQTEGLEVHVWHFADGPLEGRTALHTPLGGRFGAVAALVDALIVPEYESIAHDPQRVADLLRDLVTVRSTALASPDPEISPAVQELLREPATLDPDLLLAQCWRPAMAVSAAESHAVKILAERRWQMLWVLGDAASEALVQALAGRVTGTSFPHTEAVLSNYRGWQALFRAALARETPDLPAEERAALTVPWEDMVRATRRTPSARA